MNVNGGALEFEIVAKTGQLNTALQTSKKMIAEFATTAQKGGEGIDAAMQKTAEQIEKAFNDIDIMSGLNGKALKELRAKYEELGKKAGDALMKGTAAGDKEYAALVERQAELKKEITIRKQLDAEIAKTADELAAEAQSFEKQKAAIDKAANSHLSLRTQMRQVIEKLAEMEQAGERGTEAYRKLQEEAGRLKDAMGDAQMQATILAHDNAGLQGVISAVSGLSGAMSAAQGVVGLFAGENENLQKIMVKVQSLMAITMGLQQVANTINKDSYFTIVILGKAKAGLATITAALSGVLTKYGVAANVANVASKALLATLTGGLTLALTGVIILIERLKKKKEEQAAAAAELKATEEKEAEVLEKIGSSYAKQVAEIETLRAALKSENYSLQEKEKILKRLQELVPDYTAELSSEGRVIRENTKAVDDYCAALEKQLKFKAAQEELEGYYTELYKIERQRQDAKTQTFDEFLKGRGLNPNDHIDASQLAGLKQIYENMGNMTGALIDENEKKVKGNIDRVMNYITSSGLGDFLQGKPSGGNGSGSGGNTEDPFTKMLRERKAQYDTYTKWINSGDEIVQKAAAQQFSGMLQEGATYLEYLKGQRDALLQSVGGDASKLNANGQANLYTLNTEIAGEAKNTAVAEFKAALQDQLAGANGLLDMLDIIAQRRAEIEGDSSAAGAGKREVLNDAQSDVEGQKNAKLQNLLQQYAGMLAEKAQFDAEYNANKTLLERAQAEATTEEQKALYAEALNGLEEKYKSFAKTASAETAALMNSEEWSQLFGDFDNLTTKQLQNLITKIEGEKATLAVDMDATDLDSVLSKLKAAKQEVQDRNPFKALSLALKSYKAEASKANLSDVFKGTAGSIDLIKGAFGAANKAMQAFGVGTDDVTQDLMGDIESMLGSAGDLAMGIATGNPLQIIQGAVGLITSALEVFNIQDRKADYEIQRHGKSLKNLQAEYAKLQNAIEHALGSDYYKASQDAIKNLKKQAEDIAAMREAEAGKKKSDADKVAEYDQQIEDNAESIKDAIEALSEEITQTTAKDLASDLGEAIAQVFTDGFSSAAVEEAIDNVVKSTIKNAVLNALKVQFLEKPLKDAILQLQAAMGYDAEGNGSWNGLTAEEQAAFRDRVKQIASSYTDAMKAYEDLFKDIAEDETDPTSLSGAIKGASQESIDLLAGQTNAVRVNQVQSIDILRQQLLHLASLDAKAGTANQLLAQIYNEVKGKTFNGDLRALGITF